MIEQNLYIIAGCNGAGKTTASFTVLPEMLNCREFVNADEIAKGLSPFQPEKVALAAGRIMLVRIKELLTEGVSFAFETTLSTKSYRHLIASAQQQGYTVTLLFFWLQQVELAKERVKIRVIEGGHNIPEHVIERRYSSGICNLFDIYLPIVDQAYVFDNSAGEHLLVAEKKLGEVPSIYNQPIFDLLKSAYDSASNK